MKKIAIVGLGWLGMPLALALSQRGYEVQGSKTSDDGVLAARRCGIDAVKLVTTPNIDCDADELDELMSADTLIITLPASRSSEGGEHYVNAVQNLVDSALAGGVQRVIFTSSTSVYGDQQGEVVEASPLLPVTPAGKRLVTLEQWLHQLPGIDIDILRLSGLVGPDRHPGRFLAGRSGVKQGNHPVNLVHLDDVIEAIIALLASPSLGSTFNLSAAVHPRRDEFYPFVAKQLGLEPPTFETLACDASTGKTVNGEAICRSIDFQYRYKDPFTMPVA
ncbi:SDR family oxidoreductase [Tatumella sp. TA1]|uniref:SDR family oxidoreductase n=1 Tax=Rosenbergiella collisarenosi TaxID=1544695 RepID=UPI0008F8C569|nr:SDR family oxidoreductase [Rosenbergiella collisarenosi]QGX91755.1 SDR family oxidoreductase [Tatumella sp. TA1]